jgi:hypothetical protein
MCRQHFGDDIVSVLLLLHDVPTGVRPKKQIHLQNHRTDYADHEFLVCGKRVDLCGGQMRQTLATVLPNDRFRQKLGQIWNHHLLREAKKSRRDRIDCQTCRSDFYYCLLFCDGGVHLSTRYLHRICSFASFGDQIGILSSNYWIDLHDQSSISSFEQTNDPFNRPNAKNKRTTATDNFVQNMRLAPPPLSLDQTLQRRIRSVVVGFLRDELHGDRYIVVLFFGRRPGGGNRVETLKSVVDLRRIFHRRRLLSVQRLLQDDRRGASILLRGRIKPCAF